MKRKLKRKKKGQYGNSKWGKNLYLESWIRGQYSTNPSFEYICIGRCKTTQSHTRPKVCYCCGKRCKRIK